MYCVDSQFMTDAPKYVAGSLQALSTMVTLEVPHVNLLTKVDLLPDKVTLKFSGACRFEANEHAHAHH